MTESPPPLVSARTAPVVDPKPRRLRHWHSRAEALIEARVRDARAHARLGDMAIARSRLAELGESLGDLMAAMRADFYRDSIAEHMRDFDPDTDEPIAADPIDEAIIGSSRCVGRGDQYAELDKAIDDAAAALRLVSSLADGEAQLALWESGRRSALRSMAGMHASDAQMAIHTLVGVLKTRRELRS